MQCQSIFDLFRENVDLNQGPNFSTSAINHSDECSSRLSPTERHLLSSDLSGELNFSFVNAGHHHSSSSFSSWDVGESSSRASLRDRAANDGLKVDSNRAIGPSNVQISDSNRMPVDVDLNVDYRACSGNPEMEASSSGMADERDISFGHSGPSSKRKVLEGSSSCFPEAENIAWQTPNHNNGSSGLSASSSLIDYQTPMNTISGVSESSTSIRYHGMRDSSHSNVSSAGIPGSYSNQTTRGPISASAHSSPLSLQLPVVHTRNTLPFRWGGSSSSPISRESGSEANFRSMIRNNEQNRHFVPSNETRTSVQDSPIEWSLSKAILHLVPGMKRVRVRVMLYGHLGSTQQHKASKDRLNFFLGIFFRLPRLILPLVIEVDFLSRALPPPLRRT